MATSGAPLIRQIPRAKLYAVFKSDELVQLVEELLYAVSTTLPADTTAIEAALDAHIADTADAHVATAIGAAPGGSRPSNTVQGQLGDLDAGKEATGTAAAAVAAHVGLPDPHTQYATDAALTAHTGDMANPHAVTKAQVGLGNADNTSDADKPVSTAQAAADAAVQAFAIQRANHTGTQTAATISDFNSAADLRVKYAEQGAQTTKAGAATLTIAELLTGIIEYTGGVANLTLPTGANIDAGILAGLAADRAFDFCVINTGAGTATLLTAAGLTLTGTMTVAAGVSAQLRVRKTAANTFTVYRIA